MTIAGFQQLPFRFGGLGMASTVAHSDVFSASLPGALAGPGVATTAAHSDVLTAGNVGVYKIAEFVLGIVTASVTFSAIPGTYRNLCLEWVAQGDQPATNTALQLRLSGDAGANYDYANGNINGSGTPNGGGSGVGQNQVQICDMAAATAPTGTSSNGRIDFQNYAGTTFHKTLTAQSSLKQSAAVGNLFNELTVAWWRNTGVVTSILLIPGAGNFAIGSSFQLYGCM